MPLCYNLSYQSYIGTRCFFDKTWVHSAFLYRVVAQSVITLYCECLRQNVSEFLITKISIWQHIGWCPVFFSGPVFSVTKFFRKCKVFFTMIAKPELTAMVIIRSAGSSWKNTKNKGLKEVSFNSWGFQARKRIRTMCGDDLVSVAGLLQILAQSPLMRLSELAAS